MNGREGQIKVDTRNKKKEMNKGKKIYKNQC